MGVSSSSLDRAIELSEQIVCALQDEDWVGITALDDERIFLIKDYFSRSHHKDKDKAIRLKTLNDQIVSQLIALQQQNRGRQQGLNQARKVSRAYLENV